MAFNERPSYKGDIYIYMNSTDSCIVCELEEMLDASEDSNGILRGQLSGTQQLLIEALQKVVELQEDKIEDLECEVAEFYDFDDAEDDCDICPVCAAEAEQEEYIECLRLCAKSGCTECAKEYADYVKSTQD
jgi:hypothetical protein